MPYLGKKIGFIGAGAMAEALITGLSQTGLVDKSDLFASDASQARLQYIEEKLGINTLTDNKDVVRAVDVLIIAVKPFMVGQILEEIKATVAKGQLIISIAAGVTVSALEVGLPTTTPVIRVMPNTPSLVGEGATALCLGEFATATEEQVASAIFASVGKVVTVRENLIDSVTGLSGSGPAYVYVMLEALIDGGVLMGLPRDVATTLAAQTVLGAAKMVLETGQHPGALKDMVTTPGGTTIAGLHAMEVGGVRATLQKAVVAATNRAREMSQK